MFNDFFEQPILNSPYEYPSRHWELDEEGSPTSCTTGETIHSAISASSSAKSKPWKPSSGSPKRHPGAPTASGSCAT